MNPFSLRFAIVFSSAMCAVACNSPNASNWPDRPGFRAGFATARITPTAFESFVDRDLDGSFEPPEDVFLDSGVDQTFDYQESGAFGADQKPGVLGVDDDHDGEIDDVLGCNPADDPLDARSAGCEYGAAGGDDVADPMRDNYDAATNPAGTEKDGKWQKVVIAGYAGVLTQDPIRPAKAVHDDIWARAMVVSNGPDVFALVSLDLVGYLHIYGNEIKRRASAETGIPFDAIVFSANHNHDAPDVVGIWAGPSDLDYEYLQRVQDAAVQVIKEAVAALRPARMRSGSASIDGCYDGASLRMKKGEDCRFPAGYDQLRMEPTLWDVPINQIDLRDPMVFNHKVTAMLFADAETEATLGTLVNFHDHPEVLGSENNNLSSDFPHYVREAMELKYGATCVYVSGTTGAQMGTLRGTNVPLYNEAGALVPDATGKVDSDGKAFPAFADNGAGSLHPPYDKIRSQGWTAAYAAMDAIEGATFDAAPKVRVRAEKVDVPIDNSFLAIAFLAIDTEARRHGYLQAPDDQPIEAEYCPDVFGRPTCIRIQIAMATVGEVTFITSPGEPSPEYLLGRSASIVEYGQKYGTYEYPAMPRLLDYVKTKDTVMLDIANGYLGYLIPESDYLSDEKHPNHYEELPSAGRRFGDTIGNKWLRMLGAPSSVTYNSAIELHP